MSSVRTMLAVLMCLGFAGSALAAEDAKKGDEKKEHAGARAVLAKAKIDMTKAIEVAQAKIPKGKPIYAISEQEDKKLLFEVFFLVGDSVTAVEVDAVTGMIAEVEENESDDIEDLAASKKVLGNLKITFAKAITTALGKVEGGKAFEVELEEEDGKNVIEVELLAGDKIMKVEIDAMTGEVLEVEQEKE